MDLVPLQGSQSFKCPMIHNLSHAAREFARLLQVPLRGFSLNFWQRILYPVYNNEIFVSVEFVPILLVL